MNRAVNYFLVCLVFAPALASGQNLFDNLLGAQPRMLGAAEDEFLDPEIAFKFTHETKRDAITLSWDIAPGYYLYRDRFKLTPQSEALAARFEGMPVGEMKDDPEFGRVEIYRDRVSFNAVINVSSPDALDAQQLTVTYQGCAEDGICYPPIKKTIDVALTASNSQGSGNAQAFGTKSVAAPEVSTEPLVLSADSLASQLEGQGLATTVAIFFGFGLLLSFTPCVFPMIPILSGIIVGQKAPVSTAGAFRLSLTYVLAMAATYALVGVVAGLFGHNLQASFQQPQWIIGFSIIFVLLALSMFGFYNLELPHAWQTKLDQLSRSQSGGSYMGVAVMGVLSAIIVGPCVAPPFAAALLYLSHQGSPLIGGVALFAMALGMGALLLVIGTAAGRIVPRSGAWMDSVKHFFGVVLLGVAIWFMSRILPAPVVIAAWAALSIISAVYLGVLEPISLSRDHADGTTGKGWKYLQKGIGAFALVYGIILLIGATLGASDPTKPLAPLVAGPVRHQEALEFITIKSSTDLDRAVAMAEQNGKRVMLDFYADWCIECKHLENNTFADPSVRSALNNVLLLRADVTANDEQDQALLKRFELFGPPAVLFFDQHGREDRAFRVLGFLGPEKFLAHLTALKHHEQKLSSR